MLYSLSRSPESLKQCDYLQKHHFETATYRERFWDRRINYPRPIDATSKCQNRKGHWDDDPVLDTLRLPMKCEDGRWINSPLPSLSQCVLWSRGLGYNDKQHLPWQENTRVDHGYYLQCKEAMVCCEPTEAEQKEYNCLDGAPYQDYQESENEKFDRPTKWLYKSRLRCSADLCGKDPLRDANAAFTPEKDRPNPPPPASTPRVDDDIVPPPDFGPARRNVQIDGM
jgi:hypothetical protein